MPVIPPEIEVYPVQHLPILKAYAGARSQAVRSIAHPS
jgi:hypothetical protein